MSWSYHNYNLFYHGHGLNGPCSLVFFLSTELLSCKSAKLNMIEPEDIINDISLALQNGTKNLQKWPNIHFEMLTSLCCVLNPVSLDLVLSG